MLIKVSVVGSGNRGTRFMRTLGNKTHSPINAGLALLRFQRHSTNIGIRASADTVNPSLFSLSFFVRIIYVVKVFA